MWMVLTQWLAAFAHIFFLFSFMLRDTDTYFLSTLRNIFELKLSKLMSKIPQKKSKGKSPNTPNRTLKLNTCLLLLASAKFVLCLHGFNSHLSEHCWCDVLCETYCFVAHVQGQQLSLYLCCKCLTTCKFMQMNYVDLSLATIMCVQPILCNWSNASASYLLNLFTARPSENQWLYCFLFAAVFVRATALTSFFFQNDGAWRLLHCQHSQLST